MADPEGMPTHYETKTTHQTTSSQSASIGIRMDYIKSVNGILKIIEIVLSIVTFICATIFAPFQLFGAGWVQFVSMAAFILTIVLFIFHFFNLIYKLPGPWILIILSLITFICALVWHWGGGQSWVEFVAITAFISVSVLFILQALNVISRIPGPWLLIEFVYYCIFTAIFLIAAIVAAVKGWIDPSVGATAFFAFAATAVFAVDTFFQFRNWRTGQTETVATTTTTTTREQTY